MDSPQSVVSPLKSSSQETDMEGALEVYIHEARDIHNICIYQKQDVYAKLCLTSDPAETTVSTKIINGGGANPIFNENVRLNVGRVDSSLKCEIWMLSRVKNYLEDQLLGFTLVPLSEILLHDGKLEKEFSLSSTDLFHSPAGFVQLSLSYIGVPPQVIPIPIPPPPTSPVAATKLDSEDMDKIEFPDPKVVNENNQMVEEYFGMPMPMPLPCTNVGSPSSDSCLITENQVISEAEAGAPKIDCGPSRESRNGAPSRKETAEAAVVRVSIEAAAEESKVVEQEIVDMYMKSMQQFTESLAKMKLPMELENGGSSSQNSTPGSNTSASASRVFYGSRAFF